MCRRASSCKYSSDCKKSETRPTVKKSATSRRRKLVAGVVRSDFMIAANSSQLFKRCGATLDSSFEMVDSNHFSVPAKMGNVAVCRHRKETFPSGLCALHKNCTFDPRSPRSSYRSNLCSREGVFSNSEIILATRLC